MAEDNAPCSDLVRERLKARTHRERIAELETALAKAEGDRDFWASDALEEVTRVWAAKDNTDCWRRYAEHWRGRVRGASEAVRAAMGREKSAWASWQVVTASLGREREEWRQSSEANAAEMMRYQIAANRAEAERDALIRQRDALKAAVRTMHDWRMRQATADEVTVTVPVLQRRLIEACAERDHWKQEAQINDGWLKRYVVERNEAEEQAGYAELERKSAVADLHRAEAEREQLGKILSRMSAALGADEESGDDPGAEVVRCVRERERTLKATVARCVAEMERVERLRRDWQQRAENAEAERDRLDRIVSSMYAELGADEESGDDPAAEVARCVAERDQLAGRVAELERVLELASQTFAGVDGGLSAIEFMARPLWNTTMEDIARHAVRLKLDCHKGNRLCRAALSGTSGRETGQEHD